MRNLDSGEERIRLGNKSGFTCNRAQGSRRSLTWVIGIDRNRSRHIKRNLMIEPQFKRSIGKGSYLLLVFVFFAAASEAHAQDKSFLWRIQSDKSNIYILGSVHFLKKDSYPLNKTIEKVFDNTQKLVLEIDLKSEDSAAVQRATLEKGIHRDRTLQQQGYSGT